MSRDSFASWCSALGLGGLGPAFEEAQRQQAAIDRRTSYVMLETGMPRQGAALVALFALGKWAERYPHRPDDLGEDAAVFLAQWCLSRHIAPTNDALHEALPAWRATEALRSLGCHKKVALPDVATLAQSGMQKLFETARRARNKRKAERRSCRVK